MQNIIILMVLPLFFPLYPTLFFSLGPPRQMNMGDTPLPPLISTPSLASLLMLSLCHTEGQFGTTLFRAPPNTTPVARSVREALSLLTARGEWGKPTPHTHLYSSRLPPPSCCLLCSPANSSTAFSPRFTSLSPPSIQRNLLACMALLHYPTVSASPATLLCTHPTAVTDSTLSHLPPSSIE